MLDNTAPYGHAGRATEKHVILLLIKTNAKSNTKPNRASCSI